MSAYAGKIVGITSKYPSLNLKMRARAVKFILGLLVMLTASVIPSTPAFADAADQANQLYEQAEEAVRKATVVVGALAADPQLKRIEDLPVYSYWRGQAIGALKQTEKVLSDAGAFLCHLQSISNALIGIDPSSMQAENLKREYELTLMMATITSQSAISWAEGTIRMADRASALTK
jgi:hypothetical protein